MDLVRYTIKNYFMANTATKKSSKPTGKRGRMENSEFHTFFVDEIKDIYWAEKHLVKALPKMKKAATSIELAQAFEKHTLETQTHIETLEQVFELLGEKPAAKKCDAMEGLLAEADSIIEDTDKGTMIRDAALILAAQKVEHYEIATYGTLVQFAKVLGENEAALLLAETLQEEKDADITLTKIAESFINRDASTETEEE